MDTLKFILLVLALCTLPILSVAQEDMESKFSISGTADVYFRQNLNLDNYSAPGESLSPGSSFANLAGFSLGMINLIGEYEGTKVGAVADLVWGSRGADAVFGSQQEVVTDANTGETTIVSGNNTIVNQLYVYLKASDAVTFTLGNFNTFLGYEVISPTANFNYSTSYMFSNGPFSHTGLKADFDLGGDFTGMLGFLNPTDATDFNPSGDYMFGAQLGYGGTFLNVLTGSPDDVKYFQIDLTAGWDISDDFYLGINATDARSGDGGFYGAALYLQYGISESVRLGFRGEYFGLKSESDTNDDNTVFAPTISANIEVGNMTIIPEIRIDGWSKDNFYVDASGTGSRSLSSFVLAAALGF